MSEYQYYEFQAIDRPLDRAAQKALRSISSRARITATSFTNHYEWGDLKGNPRKFMERWFDLHLYLANWGTRRLILRMPARLVNRKDIDRFLREIDWVEIWTSGDNLIVDIQRDEEGADDDWDDGSGRLAALAPLRTDVLSGDLSLFYLLWLTAVQDELIPEDEIEPLPGLAPLTGALEAFADFFGIDPDLVEAAVELGADHTVVSRTSCEKRLRPFLNARRSSFCCASLTATPMRVLSSGADFAGKTQQLRHAGRPVHCECGRWGSERLVSMPTPNAVRRNGAAKQRRPKKRAACGSKLSSNAASASGGILRKKSNAATQRAMTRRQGFFPIFRRWL
jgi:hypothetical protein